MIFFVLRKLILHTRIRSHPVGLDVWFLVRPFVYFHTSCANNKGCGETVWIRRLPSAFAGRLCDKYHNLMRWLIYRRNSKQCRSWLDCSTVDTPNFGLKIEIFLRFAPRKHTFIWNLHPLFQNFAYGPVIIGNCIRTIWSHCFWGLNFLSFVIRNYLKLAK